MDVRGSALVEGDRCVTKQACYVKKSSVHEQVGKIDGSNSVHEPLAIMHWRLMASALVFFSRVSNVCVYTLVAL